MPVYCIFYISSYYCGTVLIVVYICTCTIHACFKCCTLNFICFRVLYVNNGNNIIKFCNLDFFNNITTINNII